jgi:uncharacterized membrane protein YhaH (DUF805 family)
VASEKELNMDASFQSVAQHFVVYGAIALLVAVVLTVVLFVPVLRKAGFSGWWIVLFMIPIVGIVFLWIFAFVQWPSDKQQSALDTDTPLSPQ